MSKKHRVVVAMSGGVDSSTAAALLHEQGHEVIGVTLKLYNAQGTSASIGGRCCSPRDISDARAVAAHLGFPYYVLDEVDPFHDTVIDDFVAEYRAGRTPNPCVKCNEKIKFGPLIKFADAVGADFLATGHYARLLHGQDQAAPPRLFRSIDRDKDQSYFLFGVRPDLMRRVMFPVGDLDKAQVREIARRAGLPNCEKPDSNQICFIPDGDHKAFVEKHGGAGRPGEIVDETGNFLAKHGGTHHFTIGQRKGLPGVDGTKRFVLSIDVEKGTVVAGPRSLLTRNNMRVENVRWLHGVPAADTDCQIQIRHRGSETPAVLTPDADDPSGVNVHFAGGIEGGAPGQAAVFYRDGEVLGGGWIAGEKLVSLCVSSRPSIPRAGGPSTSKAACAS